METTEATKPVEAPADNPSSAGRQPGSRAVRKRRSTARRRAGTVALVASLLIVTAACNVVEGRHYGVSFGLGNPVSYHARIFQKPSWQIVVWNDDTFAPYSAQQFQPPSPSCSPRSRSTIASTSWPK